MEDKDVGMQVLEMIITGQLLLERLEVIDQNLNRRKIKKSTKELLKELEPIAEQYNKIYLADEEVSREIVWELDKGIKLYASGTLEERVFISQALEAFRKDKKSAEKEIHKIITN